MWHCNNDLPVDCLVNNNYFQQRECIGYAGNTGRGEHLQQKVSQKPKAEKENGAKKTSHVEGCVWIGERGNRSTIAGRSFSICDWHTSWASAKISRSIRRQAETHTPTESTSMERTKHSRLPDEDPFPTWTLAETNESRPNRGSPYCLLIKRTSCSAARQPFHPSSDCPKWLILISQLFLRAVTSGAVWIGGALRELIDYMPLLSVPNSRRTW